MGRRTRLVSMLIAATLTWLGQAGLLRAQAPNLGTLSSPTGMGSLAMSPGQLMGTGGAAKQPSDSISINDSFVSFIDGAMPRNMVLMRFEAGYNNPQPTRAEYLFSKSGLPNSPGFPRIETKVDNQEWDSYAEFAWTPWLSMFIQAPYRWVNPEVNANQSGTGSMQYGLKLCTWSADSMIATFLVRVYQPSANANLGSDHWTVEPGLLAAYQISSNILLEGEISYWKPLGGTDFAGDVLRYGVGLSYGRRQPGGFWYTPVVECIGWTVLSGKTLLASSPDSYVIQDAHGQTIVNGYLGVRWGYGSFDFYAGYGRAFTGEFWQRDTVRLEVRLLY